MPAYAILRVAKLKGAGKAAASGHHLERTRDTPNADRARSHLNERLAGSGELWADIEARLRTLRTRPKSNAVHAIELLLSASPAHFAGGDSAALMTWVDASLAWARGRFGTANVVAAMLHMDEETPHLHVVAVPIVEKTLKGKAEPEPRLCARDITGGRYRLSRLQDEYAAAVKHLGIERGVKGARIEYDHLHHRYADMTSTPPAAARILEHLQVRKGKRLADPGRWAEEETARLLAEVGPPVTALAARCEELERRTSDDEKRIEALQKELHAREAQAVARGRVDLGDVIGMLGGVRERHDPHLWRLGPDSISVDGRRYRDLTQRREGTGAVDLLTHLTGCDAKQALIFLAQRVDARLATAEATERAVRSLAQLASQARESPPLQLKPLREVKRPAEPAPQAPTKDTGLPAPRRGAVSEVQRKREEVRSGDDRGR